MLGTLITGLATGETVAALRRARRALIAYLLALILGGIGAVFLLAALYIWAARRWGSVEAALWFGGGFLGLAVLVLIVHKIASGVRARAVARQRNRDLTAVAVTAALAVAPALLRGRLGAGVLLAPLVASVAYAIYRENRRPPARGDDPPSGG